METKKLSLQEMEMVEGGNEACDNTREVRAVLSGIFGTAAYFAPLIFGPAAMGLVVVDIYCAFQ